MTKHTFYYLALFFPLFITNQILSQDFDEAFLESLPDSIAADLLDSVKQKEFDDEIKYTRPSSKLTKPEIVVSERFGINIFSTMQSTFMPLNEPNVDNDYILDFGDTLEIQIVGEKSSLIKSNINILKCVPLLFFRNLCLSKYILSVTLSKISCKFVEIDKSFNFVKDS